jgi:site-specific DNA-methyltransferase (adenine-specific)
MSNEIVNKLICGDNLEILPTITTESIDLIYIDPPFNSSRNYEVFWGEAQEKRAFEDRFGDVMSYVDWMRPRIREMHRILKPTGSFYYHCDWHASHYVKVELDRVFGFENFRNEIIWHYKFRMMANRYIFNRKHDTIFFYAKSKHTELNMLTEPWTRDEIIATRKQAIYADEEGLEWIWMPGGKGHSKNKKKYLNEIIEEGKALDDVWDMPIISSSAKERLGYPTQKPLALLERIVRASSDERQVVLDAFCGCGTTLEAAAMLKRHWIGIDFSPTACRVIIDRLRTRLNLKDNIDFELKDMPKSAEQLRHMPPFEFENWAVVALGGIPNKIKVGDYGIDGRLYLADIEKKHKGDFTEMLDVWYPIQVKQIDKTGRPDIDRFETAMRRDKRVRGYFVAFGFSSDALREIKRANQSDGLDIIPITVEEILRHEKTITG